MIDIIGQKLCLRVKISMSKKRSRILFHELYRPILLKYIFHGIVSRKGRCLNVIILIENDITIFSNLFDRNISFYFIKETALEIAIDVALPSNFEPIGLAKGRYVAKTFWSASSHFVLALVALLHPCIVAIYGLYHKYSVLVKIRRNLDVIICMGVWVACLRLEVLDPNDIIEFLEKKYSTWLEVWGTNSKLFHIINLWI